MRNDVLYYPHIEIANEGWLKGALLFWDKVYRIVPSGHIPHDSDEVKRAVDAGMLRNVTLENGDFRDIAQEFESFLNNIDFLPAGLSDYDDVGYLHPEKIDAKLYPALEKYAAGISDDGFLELPREVVRGYMFFLSETVAKRRLLDRCTDDKYSFSVAPYFSEDANFDEWLNNPEAIGFYSSLIIKDVLPFSASHLPMAEIIEASRRSADEKLQFRKDLYEFADGLHGCESADHARFLFNDLKDRIEKSKERLTMSRGINTSNALSSLFTMGVPTSLTAFGTLLAAAGATANPYDLRTIGSSLLIGAVAAYQDFRKAKPASKTPSGVGYLLSLEEQFSSGKCFPRFDRYLNEFIND